MIKAVVTFYRPDLTIPPAPGTIIAEGYYIDDLLNPRFSLSIPTSGKMYENTDATVAELMQATIDAVIGAAGPFRVDPTEILLPDVEQFLSEGRRK